jgi:hypothetical protein
MALRVSCCGLGAAIQGSPFAPKADHRSQGQKTLRKSTIWEFKIRVPKGIQDKPRCSAPNEDHG